jgi:signal transduction histidine kinase
MRVPVVVKRHRDEIVAVALAVAYAAEVRNYPDADLRIALPLAIGAGLCTAMRRRAPFATFLLVSVLNEGVLHWAPGFDSQSAVFVVVFLYNLYSLGAHARGVEAWLGALGVLATIVTFVVGDGAHDASDVLFALAFVGTPWGAGVVVRFRGDRERELRERNLALQEEADRAVAAERARIARELHDVVSHAIAVTVLQARGGRKMVGRDDDAVRRTLVAIEDTNVSALADMRRLLTLLREAGGGDAREPAPSLDRIGQLVDQVRASGLPVELRVMGDPLPIPPGLDLSAYRIVQESLTNVLKHAGPGAHACVEVCYGSAGLDIAVSNTGAVPAVSGAGGHGLLGIRERAAVAGGSLEAGPAPDGYAVRAHLPYVLDAT